MKTRNHLHPAAARRLAVAFCTCIALASCGSDDNDPVLDPPGPGPEPAPTMIPLIINAEVYAAAPDDTRTNSPAAPAIPAQWTDGDWVAVEVDGVVKRYIATASADNAATATLRPADADNTHYCPATECKLRAWRYGHTDKKTYIENFDWNHQPEKWWTLFYQAITDGSETDYRKSGFLYAPEKTVSSSAAANGGNIGLTFYHQTARVVVNILNEKQNITGDKRKIIIYLKNGGNGLSVLGTFDAGRIDPANGQYSGLKADRAVSADYVIMKPILPATEGYEYSYEALVIPQNVSGQEFMTIIKQDGNWADRYRPGSGQADLQGGYTYTYEVTIPLRSGAEVAVYPPIAGWIDRSEAGNSVAYDEMLDLNLQNEINDNRTYLLTGRYQKVDAPVLITGGSPTIILKDADIRGRSPISIFGGAPIFRVEGKNEIISTYGPVIKLGGTEMVRIIGDGRDKSSLTALVDVGQFSGTPAIGNENNVYCHLSLSGLTLVAKGCDSFSSSSAAAIGLGGSMTSIPGVNHYFRKCGSITISDCHVDATAGHGAAAIGFGYDRGTNANNIHEMGNIIITNSTIRSTVINRNGVWPAHIGGSANGTGKYTVGDIVITPPEGMDGTEFFANFRRSENDEDAVVGYLNEFNAGVLVNGATIEWRGSSPETFSTAIPWGTVSEVK